MTDTTGDPIAAVLDELRALRETVERGIASTKAANDSVDSVRAEIAEVRRVGNRRAKWFRWLWAGLATAIIAGAVIITLVFTANDRHQQCFQQWANDTAQRSERLTDAAETAQSTLNDLLDLRAQGLDVTDPRVKAATMKAAAAGDSYERIRAANPPVPPEAVTCASPSRHPSGSPSR